MNNKIYVGQTWGSLKDRLTKHNSRSSNCKKLYRSINKYGINNFIIEPIIGCCTQEMADDWEQFFIQKFNSIENGYNILNGGMTGSRSGIKHSEETKKKMSISKKGKPSHLKGKIGFMKGKTHTDISKKNMSQAMKLSQLTGKHRLGIHLSLETKQKISESNIGNHKGKTWKIINGKRVWLEK